jgi:hypothetical protein
MTLSSQTQSARVSLIYITLGTLIDIWTAVYYFLIMRPTYHANAELVSQTSWFWITGFFFTGLALVGIGLLIGQIGKAARHAEIAPPASLEPTPDNATGPQERTPQAPPPIVIPTPMMPAMAPMTAQPQMTPQPLIAKPAPPVAAHRP